MNLWLYVLVFSRDRPAVRDLSFVRDWTGSGLDDEQRLVCRVGVGAAAVVPIIQVESVSTFALKITLMIVAMNLVEIGILLSARQRSPVPAAKARLL